MRIERAPELIVVTAEPFNAETPLDKQVGTLTPAPRHYVRSHFPVPDGVARLVIDGAVSRALELTLAELLAMPSRSDLVTLECAGNGRSFLEPQVNGEQWALGAVGTAEWTGVPLRDLLSLAGVGTDAKHVVFAGADRGTPKDVGHEIAYERSLPLADALDTAPLVAYAMNGDPLPPDHGAPFRLVVPGLYGMASVKWLARITVGVEPSHGFYQQDRYVEDGRPLPPMAPRAVITSPQDGARVRPGRSVVRGYAWAGASPIAAVEVSTDAGATWQAGRLGEQRSPYAWREWQHEADLRGDHVLIARARTRAGETQPLEQRHRPLGYMNNAARPVRVSAT